MADRDNVLLADEAERDARLLADVPELVCIGLTMKATPREEGGERFIYIQASDESTDAQGERVLCKALQESAQVFLRHGSLDIDHIVLMGPRSGVPDYMSYEIGRPTDVRFEGDKTFVKAQLYSGDTPLAKNANMVWDSITKLNPPARWYPSIGGGATRKSIKVDPVTKARVPVIEGVRWTNLALSRVPVNQSVPVASAAPIGIFAKSLGGFVMQKTMTAGYGTDLNDLSGGAALREQSLDPRMQSYWGFSEAVAGAIRKGECGHDVSAIADHAARHWGVRQDKATAWASRFLADLHDAISQGNK